MDPCTRADWPDYGVYDYRGRVVDHRKRLAIRAVSDKLLVYWRGCVWHATAK